ncbi:MAG: mevalonate kinase [Candidatus Promineifilaceae bacterium]
MTTTTASAPGKIILFGEHAVVYGQPAIAAPVSQVRARAWVEDADAAAHAGAPAGSGVCLHLTNLDYHYTLSEAPADDPFAAAVRLLQQEASMQTLPPLSITIHSDIPIASGLGSGAATAAALLRALARHLGLDAFASDAQVSRLAFAVEQLHHGTPSGIDNTVVAYEKPVYFVRQQPENRIEPFTVASPLSLLIADTGVSSSTKTVVSDVRRQWQAEPARFDALFARCGQITDQARRAIEAGDIAQVGALMNQNQELLRQLTVSSPALERLITAALSTGAIGAKLSGAGRGGNMIALIAAGAAAPVRAALLAAGARAVLASVIGD